MCAFCKTECTSSILNQISQSEKEQLEAFFAELVVDAHFGYSLFGDKPVSLTGHFLLTPWNNVLELHKIDGDFWQKWKIWEKYQKQLEITHYLLVKEPASFKNSQFIILINKKAFIHAFTKHAALFHAILGAGLKPEKILQEIAEGKKTFFESIRHNPTLLGLLLGYGEHNAICFSQKGKILKMSCLRSFGDDSRFSLLRVGSLYFLADFKHPETQALYQKYEKLRGRLSTIYAHGNFLPITLSKLTE
ncbi:hypothetical protein [Parachlamydia sp. AcF125]|uniref:hypothetical protein n=1 Tax=Parachlamydia sp. AcF125 TaxID=2795736 RepID=UPI001BC9F0C4|nr:hypothetical protein [Parachlamydia sp. AcF125]MBS4167403.1 hypothetical protein [Parachlamydia sp. AcF125]